MTPVRGNEKPGRWKAWSSVSRYEKAGRLGKEYEKLDSVLRSKLEWCADNLECAVLRHRSVPWTYEMSSVEPAASAEQ